MIDLNNGVKIMTLDEKIHLYAQKLPYSLQEKVFYFVQYLLLKTEQHKEQGRSDLSVSSAMSDMEDEPDLYSPSDIRTTFS